MPPPAFDSAFMNTPMYFIIYTPNETNAMYGTTYGCDDGDGIDVHVARVSMLGPPDLRARALAACLVVAYLNRNMRRVTYRVLGGCEEVG